MAISPPRLNQMVAVVFQDSASASVALRSSPAARAAVCASPVEIVGMKALVLHHAISAMMAMRVPRTVMPMVSGANRSRMRAGGAFSFAACQRSGSFTNIRTTKARAAGIRPNRNTTRQEDSGESAIHTAAT